MSDIYLVVGLAIIVILLMVTDYVNGEIQCEGFNLTVNNHQRHHRSPYGYGYSGYYDYYNRYSPYLTYYSPFYYMNPWSSRSSWGSWGSWY